MVHIVGEQVDVFIPDDFNLTELLVDKHVLEGRGNNTAFYDLAKNSSVTYGELRKRICKAGNMLIDLGLEIEDRIAFVMLDSIEYVELMLGAIRIGAQPILLSTIEQPQFYEFVLKDSVAKAVVVHNTCLDKVIGCLDKLKYLRKVIIVGNANNTTSKFVKYDDFVKDFNDNLQAESLKRDDFCYWQYSSGSTGPPKGVIHYQQDPLYSCQTYYRHILKMDQHDINFSTSKIFFAYGLGNTIWGPLYFGASAVVNPSSPDPALVFNIISDFKVTLFYSVPVVYSKLLAWVSSQTVKPRLDTVKYCVSAGEALPVPIFYQWMDFFGKEILDGIGTTEMCHIFISNRHGEVKPGSSGRVVPGYEIKIVDEKMSEVPVNTPGRLLVKGGSVAAMFWRRHEKTKEHFLGEWFYTGDIYMADEKGFLTHLGRADDLIKSAGAWVSPLEVESAILTHPSVLECAVVQAYTEEGLGRPKAYVVLKDGYEPSVALADEIGKKAAEVLKAGYKIPSWIVFVKDLPKTATGKIQRYKLREMRA